MYIFQVCAPPPPQYANMCTTILFPVAFGMSQKLMTELIFSCLPVWRDKIRHLATDPVVMRTSPATDIYVVHCWLINPNKLNLILWLLAYLSDNKAHGTNLKKALDVVNLEVA